MVDKFQGQSNRITACVVNHNGENYLPDCLLSLSKEMQTFEEIILVDNASQDRSIEFIRNNFPF